MKKILILILALAVLLTACSTTTSDADGTNNLDEKDEGTTAEENTLQDGVDADALAKQKACPLTTTLTGKTTVCKDGSCDFTTINEALSSGKEIVITDCETYEETIVATAPFKLDCQNAVIKGDNTNDIVQLKNNENVKVENCELTNGKIAVSLLVTKNSEFKNNYIHNNQQGMRIKLSPDNKFVDNEISNNSDDGATFRDASINNLIKNNKFNNNAGTGLIILSSPNQVENNEFNGNQRGGFNLQGRGSTVSDNELSNNKGSGLFCNFAQNSVIEGNTCEGNDIACKNCPYDACTETTC